MPTPAERPSALVVVLGDLGRSPRMINHARALRARGWSVSLAGYAENGPPPDLADDPAVRIVELAPTGGGRWRAFWRLAAELRRKNWTAVIVQNPPGFPALMAAELACGSRTRRVLDWHNLGGSMLALRSSPRRWIARPYAWIERSAARIADDHWAVSAALSAKLGGFHAVVVHDRPSRICRDIATAAPRTPSPADRAAWWRQVLPQTQPPDASRWIVAPSSWGPDEDYQAILRAAKHWRTHAKDWGDAPTVAIIATGRGPGLRDFERAAAAFRPGPLSIRTAWMPAGEYPALLARADAGLCLHRSSSGLDLPMKLADFRGAGRKALVLDYGPVLAEVFKPGADGWTFRNDAELAIRLRELALTPACDLAHTHAGEDLWEAEWDRQLGSWASAREREVPSG